MPFSLSEDERLLQKVVREFARDRLGLDQAESFDRHDRFPEEPLREAAALGLAALALPPDEGGAGPTAMALALDELAQVCPNTAAVLASHNALGLRLLLGGGEATAQVRAAAGKGEVVCTLASEEAHGPDKSRLGTAARPAGGAEGGFVLSGQKVWGLGAAGAKHLLVLAADGQRSSWFHVPADASGVVVGRNEPLLGLRGAGVRTVYLSEVKVPAEARIGAAGTGDGSAGRGADGAGGGGGAERYRDALAWHQVATAACLNGCLAGALEDAARFAGQRVQFGKPIGSYQAVSDNVAHVDVEVAASRALTLEAAALLETGGEAARVAAARAKIHAARLAVDGTRRCIRIEGGTGFMRESPVQRFARDARALQFVAEPDVVQKDLLRRRLLDIPFGPTP